MRYTPIMNASMLAKVVGAGLCLTGASACVGRVAPNATSSDGGSIAASSDGGSSGTSSGDRGASNSGLSASSGTASGVAGNPGKTTDAAAGPSIDANASSTGGCPMSCEAGALCNVDPTYGSYCYCITVGWLCNPGSIDASAPGCMIAASSYDQSCTEDTDCVEVTAGNYCVDSCQCGGDAISKGALAQFKDQFGRRCVTDRWKRSRIWLMLVS